MARLETVKIKSSLVPAGFMVINKSDFDQAKDILYETAPSPDPEKPPLMLEVNETPVDKKTSKKTSQSTDA